MLLASAAGVRVFVTGGIGGVHRGAEHTMDVSADLTELGRTPVAVICAGVKTVRSPSCPSPASATWCSREHALHGGSCANPGQGCVVLVHVCAYCGDSDKV